MRSEYVFLVLLFLVVLLFIFILSCADINYLNSAKRSPSISDTPIVVSPSDVHLISKNRNRVNSFTIQHPIRSGSSDYVPVLKSPGRYASGSIVGDLPVFNFFDKPKSKPRYKFEVKNRKFGSIGEKLCCKILEEEAERELKSNYRPDFMKNPETGRNLEIDVLDDEIIFMVDGKEYEALGLEYSGEQHYRYTPKYHRNVEEFNEQLKRDTLKLELCSKSKVYLIVVPYTVDTCKLNHKCEWKYIKRSEEERERLLRAYIEPIIKPIYTQIRGHEQIDDDLINMDPIVF